MLHLTFYILNPEGFKKWLVEKQWHCKVMDCKWVDFAYWWSSIGEGLLPKGLHRLVLYNTSNYADILVKIICSTNILLLIFHRTSVCGAVLQTLLPLTN